MRGLRGASLAPKLLPELLRKEKHLNLRWKTWVLVGLSGLLLNLCGAIAVVGKALPAVGSGGPQSAAGAQSSASTKDTSREPAGAKAAPADAPPDPDTYRIGIDDELLISVWKEPDFSGTVVVRPDGKITLPLLNDIYVVGLQTTELQALLTTKLKPFVTEPQVTVVVRGIKSRKVYVYGQVGRAGAYSLVEHKTVLEALAEAGGLATFAKRRSIYVLRQVDNKQVRIPFNYNDALKAKKPDANFELYPGDIVVVP